MPVVSLPSCNPVKSCEDASCTCSRSPLRPWFLHSGVHLAAGWCQPTEIGQPSNRACRQFARHKALELNSYSPQSLTTSGITVKASKSSRSRRAEQPRRWGSAVCASPRSLLAQDSATSHSSRYLQACAQELEPLHGRTCRHRRDGKGSQE